MISFDQMYHSQVEEILDSNIRETYDRLTFKQVSDRIYNLIFERASQGMAWGIQIGL
jgi:hypothetical protein